MKTRIFEPTSKANEKMIPPFTMKAIGIIRSPLYIAQGTPIQPAYGEDVEGDVIVHESYESALLDIEGFERIWLIFLLDRAAAFQPRVIPYRDTKEHGLFSTRSPSRPNPIGLSVVHLIQRNHNVLRVRGLDILDESPLLDLKPYIPQFDAHLSSKAGWFDESPSELRNADGRFHDRKKS